MEATISAARGAMTTLSMTVDAALARVVVCTILRTHCRGLIVALAGLHKLAFSAARRADRSAAGHTSG
jgi:hypothetical protein